jgi:hypothetical protein
MLIDKLPFVRRKTDRQPLRLPEPPVLKLSTFELTALFMFRT